jgi:hypothetical protein
MFRLAQHDRQRGAARRWLSHLPTGGTGGGLGGNGSGGGFGEGVGRGVGVGFGLSGMLVITRQIPDT